MEFFHQRGRCSEEEEVNPNNPKLKLPYSSSSSSSSWGSQFYDNHRKIWLSPEQEGTHKEEKRGGGGEAEGGEGGEGECVEREHMFDKVVTPSDVGKLNRLVIPKQHAEKYFPLDSTANEKGLLLNFEDRSGKPWRFRYSYWNSSQSYVMTKGWSRFVKEKKLYAGDIVSFERGAGESVKDRLYIDWRRRSEVHEASLPPLPLLHPLNMPRSAPWGGLMLPPLPMQRDEMVWQRMNYAHHQQRSSSSSSSTSYPNGCYNVVNPGSSPIFYLRSSASQQIGLVQGGGDAPMVFNSVPVVHGKASAKRLRLFGVNLDCPTPEIPEYQFMDPNMSSLSPPIPPGLQLRLYNNESLPEEQSDSPSMSLDLDM